MPPTVIKATLENASSLREVIANWPELNNVIDSLREQNLFPGLRFRTLTVADGVSMTDLKTIDGEQETIENRECMR